MDYYEEFGVSPSASNEEIRQAHKRLARLFHPDRCQDEELRSLAESQMKRINAIFSVLADPQHRIQYDMDRAGSQTPQSRRLDGSGRLGWQQRLRQLGGLYQNAIWLLAAVTCVTVIYWFFSSNSSPKRASPGFTGPRAMVATTASPALSPQPDKSRPRQPTSRQTISLSRYRKLRSQNADLRRRLLNNDEERRALSSELASLRNELGRLRDPVHIEPARPLLAAPGPTSLPEAANVSKAVPSKGLAGTWFYVPRDGPQTTDELYPPEYIETVISEDDGQVRGRYRGRYRVTDRAISPEVAFRFDGVKENSGRYRWTGRDGAKGEVRLTLVSENSLEVEWFANQLGTQMGLGSGTALLIRREEP